MVGCLIDRAMVKYIFGNLLLLLSCTAVFAQVERQAQFRLSVPSQTNESFFLRHPNTDHILLNYVADEVVKVSWYNKVKKKTEKQYSGDFRDTSIRISFIDQYGIFVIPPLPAVSISFQSSIVDFLDEKNYYAVEAQVKKDSIVYLFSLLKYSERNRPFCQEQQSNVARFVGDISLFDNLLNKKYKLKGKTITRDSVFSFLGFIQPDSTLTDIRAGTDYENEISNVILRELERVGKTKSWHPGVQLGYKGKKFIRLHVFLLPNGRISIMSPRILRINEQVDSPE
jgi:hypothetical protein